MTKINITCDTCHKTHEVKRDKEAPKTAISMGCNWCPDCEDRAEDYYTEWYNYNDGDDKKKDIPVDPNQLCMPFILDEIIGVKKPELIAEQL